MTVNNQSRAMVCAVVGNAIFGFSFMFSRLAMTAASPLQLLSLRFLFAFVLMNALLLTGKVSLRLKGRRAWRLLSLGVLEPVSYFLCESNGILHSNASFSGLMIALIPVVSLGFGFVFLHEKPTALQVAFSFLSIGGVVWMALCQSADGVIEPIGVLLLCGAVLSAVIYNVLSRKLSREFTAFERTYVMFLMGCITFTVMGLSECGGSVRALAAPLREPVFLLSLLYLGGLSSVGAFMLLNHATTYLALARTSAFANLTTLISVLAGVIFLREPFTLSSAIACVVILVGVFGVQRYAARQETSAP